MPTAQHQDLASGRWSQLSFAEQMGNIGSEVGRAVSYLKKGESENKKKALRRAFELLDFTIEDDRWNSSPKLRELMRARETLADFFYGDNFYRSSPENIEKYFFDFALLARRSR